MFMGLFIHIYIIFGTNLLTGGLAQIAVFLPISVFRRKGISNGIKTDGKLFWNICDFWEVKSTQDGARGGHEGGAHAHSS